MKFPVLILVLWIYSAEGNLFCNLCRCALDTIMCREVDIIVVVRNSEINHVEMRGMVHLDFKDCPILKWKWLINHLPNVFPNMKTVDIRGKGLCIPEKEKKQFEIQDDCR